MRAPVILSTLQMLGTGTTEATATVIDVGSGATDGRCMLLQYVPLGGKIIAAGFILTEAVTVSAVTITVYVRPSPVVGTETNRRTVGTITLPVTSSTIGDVIANGVLSVDADSNVNAGEVIEIDLTTKSGGAGEGIPWLLFELTQKSPLGEADATGRSKTYRSNAIGKLKTVVS